VACSAQIANHLSTARSPCRIAGGAAELLARVDRREHLDREGQYVPKYVWMARHASEGVLIPWDQVEQDPPGHPVVYPAFGGHPSYPSCGAHGRATLAAAVYDYVVCGPALYTFSGATTRLVDLAHVGWSCWPGYFGTTVGTTGSSDADDPTGQILVAGPRSPLQQAENQHVCTKTSG
jgi:hypothetical protein